MDILRHVHAITTYVDESALVDNQIVNLGTVLSNVMLDIILRLLEKVKS